MSILKYNQAYFFIECILNDKKKLLNISRPSYSNGVYKNQSFIKEYTISREVEIKIEKEIHNSSYLLDFEHYPIKLDLLDLNGYCTIQNYYEGFYLSVKDFLYSDVKINFIKVVDIDVFQSIIQEQQERKG